MESDNPHDSRNHTPVQDRFIEPKQKSCGPYASFLSTQIQASKILHSERRMDVVSKLFLTCQLRQTPTLPLSLIVSTAIVKYSRKSEEPYRTICQHSRSNMNTLEQKSPFTTTELRSTHLPEAGKLLILTRCIHSFYANYPYEP